MASATGLSALARRPDWLAFRRAIRELSALAALADALGLELARVLTVESIIWSTVGSPL
jgi:hypothetical protein